ncbi:glycosyltransferase family 4 protein [Methylophilus aquaticus]|uniref:Glycosyltransferase family 1 protein n=1 Tax=Methylophilus aquaticus TaxID=1971610 RepID=A0ABT9JW25_9PROT|nr:glycosyltransferase family 1 protein [Methylophilus aquaticus]MDP8568670.1 glycosyltransferase family 1 protein [Methylophilus aquaticus]
MTVLIVTDTFQQTNGVSTTYKNLRRVAKSRNIRFRVLHPSLYRWIPLPFYPEIQLTIQPWRLWRTLQRIQPEQLHIATEGLMGLVARCWCNSRRIPYSTSYHTRFPEYLELMWRIPAAWTYAYLRWFHRGAMATFVSTESMRQTLQTRGFGNLVIWSRGVSAQLMSLPRQQPPGQKLRVLNVGRVSREKNLDALCMYQDDFEITIAGDGPYLKALKQKYPRVNFVGYQYREALAGLYAAHDVFAFPSRTDTFGIVMIEAMCNGLPVAAFDVTGPRDVVERGFSGVLHHDLKQAILKCRGLDRQAIRLQARSQWSWAHCFETFLQYYPSNLLPSKLSPSKFLPNPADVSGKTGAGTFCQQAEST